MTTALRSPRVAIIGAGMSGILMGIKLKAAGVHTFSIYEKAGSLGGTWRDNAYPGLVCDVNSRLYAYSFEPNREATRWFPPGPEIRRYLERVAGKYGVVPHIRFNQEIVEAEWADERWCVRTADGAEDEVDLLVSASGFLHHPKLPDIAGLHDFAGATLHSARWDDSVDLSRKRVGVIGTGSTGVQLTTALSVMAARLSVFQRTAQWICPVPNPRYSRMTRTVLRRVPIAATVTRLFWRRLYEQIVGTAGVRPGWERSLVSAACRTWLRLSIHDRELRRRLTPDHEPMCKRLVMSGGYFRALRRPNVDLVTQPIERVESRGIRTADGVLHELDVLVLATGFDAHAFVRPIRVSGVDALTLDETWQNGPNSYLTVALPGFPGFFMLVGPYSPFANQSVIAIAEAQADYILQWVEGIRCGDRRPAAPSRESTDRFQKAVREAMPETVWTTGCKSWYLSGDGTPIVWPWSPSRHREMLRTPVWSDFR